MYRESFQHYAIRDTLTSEKWMIPNKNTCQEVVDRLNRHYQQIIDLEELLDGDIK